MGKVNVVLPSGRVVSVDADVAAQGRLQQEGGASEAGRHEQERNEAAYGGTLGTAAELAQSFADTATFGGLGKAESAIGGDDWSNAQQQLADQHGVAHFVGEAGALLTGAGAAGLAHDAGEGVAQGVLEKYGAGVATKGVQRAATAAGRITEGAIFGAGAHVADTNVTGDPLTIEGTVESAGIGSLISLGAGAAADTITRIGGKAAAISDEAKVVQGDMETVQAGREVFAKPPESWDQYADALKAKQSAAQEEFGSAVRQTEKYKKFTSGAQLDREITKAENAVNSISRRWNEDVVIPTETPPTADLTPKFDTSDTPVEGASPSQIPQEQVIPPGRTTREIMNTETGEYVKQVKQAEPVAAPLSTKPPISEEMQGRLKDFRDRIRRIDQLRSGGFELDTKVANKFGGSEWVKKNPAIAGDPAKAAEELRSLQNDLRQQFPKATRKVAFGEIPPTPPKIPPEPEKLRLPKTLQDLARQRSETVNKIANASAGDPNVEAAWSKVASDLGVKPDDGIAGLHNKLGGYISASERLKKYAEASAKKSEGFSIVSLGRKLMRGMAIGGLGRAADAAVGGGLFGAGARAAASEAGRVGMTNLEESALGGILLRAKLGVQDKAGSVVAKAAKPLAHGIERLRPVTSYLAAQFPDGPAQPSADIRTLANRRSAEINNHALTVNDNMYLAMSPFQGDPSDVAWKIHNHVTSAMQYLANSTPKDPGTVNHLFGSDWVPSQQDSLALAYRMEAVLSPMDSIQRSLSGDGHPAAVEALWTIWPNLMQQIAEHVAQNAEKLQGLTYERTQAFSQTFRAPLSGLQEPAAMLQLQGMYLPPPSDSGPSKQPSKQPTGNPTGRPATVNSPAAGTNVSMLTSQ